ncbi:hypothetical protein C8P64_2049 [Christiangramia gaetbulicola]|uniref:Uncharacterized protein n=1 Tax=Christiangramia gaetbulicola TaxID=703340 RepID=A0A2T6AI97_9FLAO|nr:hypothetical protein [Christiangramia gaetbulicola]PTX43521.1 hypothetical protein C8P64_2049 [Christiangramia gaetbulicola]
MRVISLFILLIISSFAQAQNEILPAEIQIKTAVLAAPESKQSGAKVYGYNQQGELVVLRKGSNNLICIADDPEFEGIQVACYSEKLEPFMSRGRELSSQGKSEMEKRRIRKEEADSGKLKMPDSPSTLYVFSGSDENYDKTTGDLKDGKFRYVVYIPYATTESTGLPDKPEAPGMPWLMDPGTHRAHIMISPVAKE